MSDNIINIADRIRKPKGAGDDGEWLFNISVFADGDRNATGQITDFNDGDDLEVADRLRRYAHACDSLAWLLRQHAERLGASSDGDCLCTIHIFEGSKILTRTHDRVETEQHVHWLRDQIDAAKSTITVPE